LALWKRSGCAEQLALAVRVWWGKRWEGEKSRWRDDKIEERCGMRCSGPGSRHYHEDGMHEGRERRTMGRRMVRAKEEVISNLVVLVGVFQ
jgi:hypothetical protein